VVAAGDAQTLYAQIGGEEMDFLVDRETGQQVIDTLGIGESGVAKGQGIRRLRSLGTEYLPRLGQDGKHEQDGEANFFHRYYAFNYRKISIYFLNHQFFG
jgi:hypothetical protein